MKNNEEIIKREIFNFLKENFIEDPYTIIIPEIQIKSSKCYNCGHRIIDLLLISPRELIGFEIKSASDNLDRLKKQLKTYKHLCNKLYVIIDINKIEKLNIKDHIGIIKIESNKEKIKSEIIKNAEYAEKIKKDVLIALLWNIEVRFILAYFGLLPFNSQYYSFSEMQKHLYKIKKKDLAKMTRFVLYERYQKIWEKIEKEKDFNISKINNYSETDFKNYKKKLRNIAKNNFKEVDFFFGEIDV